MSSEVARLRCSCDVLDAGVLLHAGISDSLYAELRQTEHMSNRQPHFPLRSDRERQFRGVCFRWQCVREWTVSKWMSVGQRKVILLINLLTNETIG